MAAHKWQKSHLKFCVCFMLMSSTFILFPSELIDKYSVWAGQTHTQSPSGQLCVQGCVCVFWQRRRTDLYSHSTFHFAATKWNKPPLHLHPTQNLHREVNVRPRLLGHAHAHTRSFNDELLTSVFLQFHYFSVSVNTTQIKIIFVIWTCHMTCGYS